MSDWSNFGALLRETRASFGWSLQDVAHRTRIPARTLRELEDNDYSNFPNRTYAKSFLAQYAEHLGIDALEWLDNFETGDPLADLDRYEYLRRHDERLETAPRGLRSDKPIFKRDSDRKERPANRPRSMATQPLLVFLVTAGIVTGAVFGFMKLSDEFSEQTAGVPAPAAEEDVALRPVSGIPETRTAVRDLTSVPRAQLVTAESEENLVAGNASGTAGTETLNSTPTTQQVSPVDIALDTPPPRAIIVEE